MYLRSIKGSSFIASRISCFFGVASVEARKNAFGAIYQTLPLVSQINQQNPKYSAFQSFRFNASQPKKSNISEVSSQVTSDDGKFVKIVLVKDVERLGQSGKVITVKAGLMRCTLYPEGSAVYATRENIETYGKSEEELKATGKSKDISGDMEKLLKVLNSKTVTVYRHARADNIDIFLEGPVKSEHICKSLLRQKHIELHPSQLLLGDEGIDSFGTFKVPLNLRTPPPEDNQIQLTVMIAERKSAKRIQLQEKLQKEEYAEN
uniref:Large ribosomal subunit protein bL9c n=1 Tax=Polytomella parva TaxID=51329 RepID=A0A7S0V342_9CHLO|mmetsp:Transcript_26788/g.49215  ORF Transcript_26788/g.49215 Transcript_26788/m.49215 type:complete len:263 (+) Transcript_26788:238-1026(+)|eukprot:CAMPEP_0175057056 /NCGR_PEP_ID=MMETSP0052_2-20121109/11038_1 /TAXON_ID=51329 ORGANISM="Polytomella parva, Strain SAG 63-3" /NCGR_SAMPLE_ID=MMETSP0052_2 /ASSEMBLY_ACC=CAM_ASM_000194 /LENGTH=262 /DNA_ID=CAMNT_0016322199 /DNA_START=217 /DNA_END=1005 /DNA_ORIENTATION=-